MKKLITMLSLVLMATGVAGAQNLSLPPEEVQNVVVTPGDSELLVSWDAAQDPDGIVVGYKIYYGVNSVVDIDDYYDGELEVLGETQFTLDNLENGVTYYMALTALDDEGYESELYSLEASGTPMSAEAEVVEEPMTPAAPTESANPVDVQPAQPVDNETTEIMMPEAPVEPVMPVVEEQQPVVVESPVELEQMIDNVAEVVAEKPLEETLEASAPKMNDAEVANLKADADMFESEGVVTLMWDTSDQEDVIAQYLYVNVNGAGWEEPILMEKDAAGIDLELDADTSYVFQITTINSDGMESNGVTLSMTTTLTKSGAGLYGVALVLAMLIGGMAYRRQSVLG